MSSRGTDIGVRVRAIFLDASRGELLSTSGADASIPIELAVGALEDRDELVAFRWQGAEHTRDVAASCRVSISARDGLPVPADYPIDRLQSVYRAAIASTIARKAGRMAEARIEVIGGTEGSLQALCEAFGAKVARSASVYAPENGAPDIVVCESPSAKDVSAAFDRIGHLGTIVVSGVIADDAISIPAYYQNIILKESRLVGVNWPDDDLWSAALESPDATGQVREETVGSGPEFRQQLNDLLLACKGESVLMVRIA